jgi:hypothetical protein
MDRDIYVVMAGCGVGESLWVKRATDKCLVGNNVFSLMDSPSYQDLITTGLFNDFYAWAHEYMKHESLDVSDPWEVNWDDFNARGIALAKRLKEELGDSAGVQYVRADKDPHSDELLLSLP